MNRETGPAVPDGTPDENTRQPWRKSVRSYYGVVGLYTLSAALIWGVNTLFLLDAGLDIFEVFVANAFFTAGNVVFEVPTGVVADTWGRRASFLLSVTILFATTLGYVGAAHVNAGLATFCAISFFIGLGFTFYSGAVEAWLVDALKSGGYEGQMDRIFARGAMVSGAAMVVAAIGGGVLGSIHLSLPYVVRAAILVIVFFFALVAMVEPGFKRASIGLSQFMVSLRETASTSITYGWNQRSVRRLMIFSFVQWGFLAWAFYAWQPHFLELLGNDAVWVAGVISAVNGLAMICGNAVVDWFSRFCGKRTTLMLWATSIQCAAAIGVGLATSFWVAAALFAVITAAIGVIGPVKQSYLHQIIPSERRASIVSFDSLFESAGGILGQTGLGYLSRARSITDGFLIGGMATVFAIPVLAVLRRVGDRADIVVGTCRQRGPCAGQGLPSVGLVDTTPRQPEDVAA